MEEKTEGLKMKLKIIVELRFESMLEGGHEDNLQFEAVLVFPSCQAPLMGSFSV